MRRGRAVKVFAFDGLRCLTHNGLSCNPALTKNGEQGLIFFVISSSFPCSKKVRERHSFREDALLSLREREKLFPIKRKISKEKSTKQKRRGRGPPHPNQKRSSLLFR